MKRLIFLLALLLSFNSWALGISKKSFSLGGEVNQLGISTITKTNFNAGNDIGFYVSSSLAPDWLNYMQEPTQPAISQDAAVYYFPMDDATPNVSIQNQAGTITLTKQGAGTASAVTTYDFTNFGKAVAYDSDVYHKGTVSGLALGTQDFYFECYYSQLDTTSTRGIFSIGNASNGLYIAGFNKDIYVRVYEGTSQTNIYRIDTYDLLNDGTRHKLKCQIDRDNTANQACWIDDIELTAVGESIDATKNVTNTSMQIGTTNDTGSNKAWGELSQVKFVVGSYTGSTTPAFKTVKTSALGSNLALTRATVRKSILPKRNLYGINQALHAVANPAVRNLEISYPNRAGIHVENTATNIILRSRQFDNAAWTDGGNAPTITADTTDVTGIQGSGQAEKYVSTGANGWRYQNSATAAANKKAICAAWLRTASGTIPHTDVQIFIQDQAGSPDYTSGLLDVLTGGNGTITTEWKRFYIYKAFVGATGNLACGIWNVAHPVTFYVDGIDLKLANASKFPSTYIYTTTATAQRSADNYSISNTELGNVFTLLSVIQLPYSNGNLLQSAYAFKTTANTGNLDLYFDSSSNFVFNYFGTSSSQAKTWGVNDWLKIGYSIDTDIDKWQTIWNGLIDQSGTDAKGTPTYSAPLYFGSNNGANALNAVVGETRIYKKYLSQGEITGEFSKISSNMGL